jgi:hypothetical protein
MRKPSQINHRAALKVHSYVHVARRLGAHPYFRMVRPVAGAQAAQGKMPWGVSALCAAYDWPTDLPGKGIMAART